MEEIGYKQDSLGPIAAPAPRIAWNTVLAVVSATVLVAICAHIAVPLGFTPVPVTMQTFAVLLLGLLFGPGPVFACLALYLMEGAVGLPVFSPHGLGGMAPCFLIPLRPRWPVCSIGADAVPSWLQSRPQGSPASSFLPPAPAGLRCSPMRNFLLSSPSRSRRSSPAMRSRSSPRRPASACLDRSGMIPATEKGFCDPGSHDGASHESGCGQGNHHRA
jgi:hypothetical protein